MARNRQTLERLRGRVDDLVANLGHYLDVFEGTGVFTGPSVYFHRKTIASLGDAGSVSSALQSDEFLDLIYATLTAWGMHRMGPKGAKLGEIKAIRASLRRHQTEIEALHALKLGDLDDPAETAARIWKIMCDLEVSATGTKIVAGTKALHHLLPDLVPPVDRQYTLRFFFGHKTINRGDEVTFKEVFPYFAEIAQACAPTISSRIGSGPMNTSASKIIDNAIVGYVLECLPKKGSR